MTRARSSGLPSCRTDRPSLTPVDDAEAAVRSVVAEGKRDGHASIRHVIDAKAKLTAFSRTALPDLKARDAAGADRLEAFVVELGKALESMAARY